MFKIRKHTIEKIRYRDFKPAIIYYDVLTDLFAIVDLKSNNLLELAIASELDYADIFAYKSVFLEQSEKESDFQASLGDSAEIEIIIEPQFQPQGPQKRNVQALPTEERQNINDNFDDIINIGLPSEYDLVEGWWLERVAEIKQLLDSDKLDKLSVEKKSSGDVCNTTTELEALTILQCEFENIVSGISRPKMQGSEKEANLNLDFKILSSNSNIFKSTRIKLCPC